MTDEFAGFSQRARNAFVREGLTTREAAIAYAKSSAYSIEKLHAVGRRTAAEIREKLGVPFVRPERLQARKRPPREFNPAVAMAYTQYLRRYGYVVTPPGDD